MTSAAFFHDHVFRVDSAGHVSSPGRLPYSAFARYLREFDELVVVARSSAGAVGAPGMLRSTGPRIHFRFDHGYMSPLDLVPYRHSVRHVIQATIEQVDVVIARLPSELGLLAVDVAQSGGKILAVEVVACAKLAYAGRSPILGRFYGSWMEHRTRAAVTKAHHAIYVTDRYLQERYPCSGNTATASNVELRARSETWLQHRLQHLSARQPQAVLGFVGSLHGKHKGLDLALRAIRRMVKAGVDVRLECAGDGPVRPWMEKVHAYGLAERVRFLGPLAGSEAVQHWMRGIDCLLHPSRAEGLPRAVIEAMWVGCPVVASDVGGTSELLDAADLCGVDDADGLAARVSAIVVHRHESEACVRRNWLAAERFSAESIVAARTAFWQAVLHDAVASRMTSADVD